MKHDDLDCSPVADEVKGSAGDSTETEPSPTMPEQPPMPTDEQRISFLQDTQSHIQGNIVFADEKAGVFITFNSALLGVLYQGNLIFSPPYGENPAPLILSIGAFGFLSVSIGLAAWVVFPKGVEMVEDLPDKAANLIAAEKIAYQRVASRAKVCEDLQSAEKELEDAKKDMSEVQKAADEKAAEEKAAEEKAAEEKAAEEKAAEEKAAEEKAADEKAADEKAADAALAAAKQRVVDATTSVDTALKKKKDWESLTGWRCWKIWRRKDSRPLVPVCLDTFRKKLKEAKSPCLVDQTTALVHTRARINVRKYRWLKNAIWTSYVGWGFVVVMIGWLAGHRAWDGYQEKKREKRAVAEAAIHEMFEVHEFNTQVSAGFPALLDKVKAGGKQTAPAGVNPSPSAAGQP